MPDKATQANLAAMAKTRQGNINGSSRFVTFVTCCIKVWSPIKFTLLISYKVKNVQNSNKVDRWNEYVIVLQSA